MDVDGVLTDGGMYYTEKGEVMKKFSTRDGMGIELLRKNKIIPAIITKEHSKILIKRADKLKVEEVFIGVDDKLKVIKELAEKYDLDFSEVAYIGDDINDLPVLEKVGLSFAPDDAVPEIKQVVDYVTSKKGGEGALREAVDFILAGNVATSHYVKLLVNSPKIVDKPWGREIWIAEEREYAGKILEINKGMQTSLDYHIKKKETLHVFGGILNVELLNGKVAIVHSGKSITFNPGDAHRLKAIDNVKIFEVSTPQLDDVFRLKEDYNRQLIPKQMKPIE
ncbi:3-deoxy-D-manno-octulosonate 8-phosphate phosphatase [Candidatus Methanophagaceae archaeon]|nr:3-deoxy-D-manno-octulosonate 8-phosphate phosphatase [Methanophagales archaeon]